MLKRFEKLVSSFKLNILSFDTFYFTISNNCYVTFTYILT